MTTLPGALLFTLATLAGLGCAPSQDAAPVAPAAPREPTGSAQPTPRNDDPLRHRRELVARADQALARHWPLDYRRPFESTSHDELELERLYLEACRAGDKPSCWIAATYELWEDYRPATIRVFENCRAGDLLSCRAIPAFLGQPGLMGETGRMQACFTPDDPCNVEALRRECKEGFRRSCDALARRLGERTEEGEALLARSASLVEEGCHARIRDECFAFSGVENGSFASQQSCSLVLIGCRTVSDFYRARGDLIRARDLFERACQYGLEFRTCLELGDEYLKGTLPEPIPGRGEALIAWSCKMDGGLGADPVCTAREASRAKQP